MVQSLGNLFHTVALGVFCGSCRPACHESEGENERGAKAAREVRRLFSTAGALNIFHSPAELKRAGNWKGDNSAAEAPQMPMKSLRDIRALHFGHIAFVFLSHRRGGGWGERDKNGFIMTTPAKVFPPSGSCIIVSVLGWKRIVSCWACDVETSDGGLKEGSKKKKIKEQRPQMLAHPGEN